MTPDLLDGLTIIAIVTIASVVLIPLFCWVLILHEHAIAYTQLHEKPPAKSAHA